MMLYSFAFCCCWPEPSEAIRGTFVIIGNIIVAFITSQYKIEKVKTKITLAMKHCKIVNEYDLRF